MSRVLAVVLISALSLAACNKAPAPPAPPAPPVAPAAPAAPAAAKDAKPGSELSIASVDLGTEVGADNRVTTALESFAPTDTIVASIQLANSAAAPANGDVGVHWSGADGNVFNEESQSRAWPSGPQAVVFRIADPKGFKPGNYKLEVSLNGSVVQMREFAIH